MPNTNNKATGHTICIRAVSGLCVTRAVRIGNKPTSSPQTIFKRRVQSHEGVCRGVGHSPWTKLTTHYTRDLHTVGGQKIEDSKWEIWVAGISITMFFIAVWSNLLKLFFVLHRWVNKEQSSTVHILSNSTTQILRQRSMQVSWSTQNLRQHVSNTEQEQIQHHNDNHRPFARCAVPPCVRAGERPKALLPSSPHLFSIGWPRTGTHAGSRKKRERNATIQSKNLTLVARIGKEQAGPRELRQPARQCHCMREMVLLTAF